MNQNQAIVFCDGASRGNPGSGGWGAIIAFGDNKFKVESLKLKVAELGGMEAKTTNNRMELTAAIRALDFLFSIHHSSSVVHIYTDSKYLMNGANAWLFNWQKNGWRTKDKRDVLNRDLWEKIAEFLSNFKISWQYVPGHVGVMLNERVDEIATAFADLEKPRLFKGDVVRYTLKKELESVLSGNFLTTNKNLKTKKANVGKRVYSYVSLVDGLVLTHKTWRECEERVKGKPAKFKKVFSEEEERELIKEFKNK